MNNQMLAYLSENSLLYKHHSGFLPNHSTVTQLCYLAHQWQMALEKGEQVHTVFLDLSKAYDRVSIPGLLFKLSNLGFSNTTLQWMSSFLMDRQQRVRVNGCLSTSKSPKSGIPQGTVLGPVLFLVYINDLPCSISSDCSIFADDTSVYNTGSKPPSICSMLSKDLNYAADWAAGNALQCREKWTLSNFDKKTRHYESLRNNEWNTNPTSHLPQAPRS